MKQTKKVLSLLLGMIMMLSISWGGGCSSKQYDAGYEEGQSAGYASGLTEGDAEGFARGYADGKTDGYEIGYADGNEAGLEKGYSDGYEVGYLGGETDGYESGYADGETDGYESGYDAGNTDGYESGYADGETDGYESGYDAGNTDGYESGYADGETDGYELGYDAGNADGYQSGYSDGEADGYEQGFAAGYNSGYSDGETAGYNSGYNDGETAGYNSGYDDGETAGYNSGYNNGETAGYNSGYDAGYNAEHPLVIEFYSDNTLYQSTTIDKQNVPAVLAPISSPQKASYDFAGWFWDKNTWLKPFTNIDFLLASDLSGTVKIHAKFDTRVGIIINQVYGLGKTSNDDQAISHSFVELYNTTSASISLEGFSLQGTSQGTNWQKLDLHGSIPSKHSLLVVLTRFSNPSARLVINDYDMAWDAEFSNKGIKVALLKSTAILTVANPFNDGYGNRALGYVDMIGVAGNDNGSTIDGFETSYLTGKGANSSKDGNSKQRSVRRINFADTDNNAIDCETLDFRTADLKYAPRSIAFGAWTDVNAQSAYGALSQFPSLYINTYSVPINSKETWVETTVSLRNTDEAFTFNDVSGDIRGRGTSSWATGLAYGKVPYRLRFKIEQAMLDSGYAARDWTLIANLGDKSLLRNYSAYHLGASLDGMSYSPGAWMIDLYLNGTYLGVYMLSDHIRPNAGRVDVSYDEDPAKCEYFIEMNGTTNLPSGEDWLNVGGVRYEILFPSDADLTEQHYAYLQTYLSNFEAATSSRIWENISPLIDLESFVDYYWVQEFYKNTDFPDFRSVFFQIKGEGAERRVEAGPVWDFDLSSGNTYWITVLPVSLRAAAHRWYNRLLAVSQFKDAVVARWNEIKNVQIADAIEHLKAFATSHQISFERNFFASPVLGMYTFANPPEVVAITTYMGQVEYLTDYLEGRTIWLDEYFNPMSTL